MIDEDDDLFAQFQHAQNTTTYADFDGNYEDDFDEDEWQRAVEDIESTARKEKVMEDTPMGDA